MDYEVTLPDSPRKAQADLKEPSPCTCGRVCFWLLWLLLFIVLSLGAIALVLYFIYQPQAPSFDVVHFQVTNLSVTTPGLFSGQFYVNGVANYSLAGYNPNKGPIYYNFINVTVNFHDEPFARSAIPAFTQGPESASTLNGSLLVQQFPVTIATGGALLSVFNEGSVPFGVEAVAGAHISILGITSPTIVVQLKCNVTIDVASSQATSKSCSSVSLKS